MKKTLTLSIPLVVSLTACTNMPTPPSQITPAYQSGLKYEQFSCNKLAVESDALARRENQLVSAQNQRIKTSETQAFWLGYGTGDGIEAAELASVRGESAAVRKAMENKRCGLTLKES